MRIFKKVQILHMHIDGVWDRWMEILCHELSGGSNKKIQNTHDLNRALLSESMRTARKRYPSCELPESK